jgi:deoxycytidine triphosphate deaminase
MEKNQKEIDKYINQNQPKTQEEANEKYLKYRCKDPFYNKIPPALLNSEDILKYVCETGMIFPFYPDKLSGASYEVCMKGPVIYYTDKGKMITKEMGNNESFVLKENAIAFITLEPEFQIPHYIILRFNLKIRHIYKGLLLGTGPLVDPGFKGKLSIPVHNLTTNPYKFNAGDGLIKIEFTKLSDNAVWAPDGSGKSMTVLNNFSKIRTVKDYIEEALIGCPYDSVRSSIPTAMEESRREAAKAQQEAAKANRALRSWGLIGLISVVVALGAIFVTVYDIIHATNSRLDGIISEYSREISELKKQILDLKTINNQKFIFTEDDAIVTGGNK